MNCWQSLQPGKFSQPSRIPECATAWAMARMWPEEAVGKYKARVLPRTGLDEGAAASPVAVVPNDGVRHS